MEKTKDNEKSLMRAAQIDTFGPPSVIHIARIPRPTPGAGQVLVRVHAAGIGPWDALIREGKSVLPQPLPLTLGSDFCGTILELGEGVTGFKPGDSVFGVVNSRFTGGQAEYAVASSGMIAPKPKTWNEIEAASAPVVAVTAWQILFEYGNFLPGQTVLVNGAAGSVGGYVLQLAKMRGIRTIAVVSSEDFDFVRGLGAEQVIDYRKPHFEDDIEKVDGAIDLVGGEMQERFLTMLRQGGLLVSAVYPLSGETEARARELGVRGTFFLVEVSTERLLMIAAKIEEIGLRPSVGEVLPLAEARLGHEMMSGRSKRKRGKIVLKIES